MMESTSLDGVWVLMEVDEDVLMKKGRQVLMDELMMG